MVQRSRHRGMEQAQLIVQAARRLITTKGSSFTTQDLVKEAGVALQTFYRYFASKDQLLLAVLEDMIAEFCAAMREQVANMADPVERLRYCVTIAARQRAGDAGGVAGPQFITSEHWRLQQEYPQEIAVAIRPFSVLLTEQIEAAAAAGSVKSTDPESDAWHIAQLVMAVFHHYAFAETDEPEEVVAERLWRFCLSGVGGTD
jgi:AcrR family transcriptional regulator